MAHDSASVGSLGQSENKFLLCSSLPTVNIVTENNMAIKPKCDKCKIELKEFGGILLSPPNKNIVKKFHLCRKCYHEISRGLGKK